MKLLIIFAVLLISSFAYAVSYPPESPERYENSSTLEKMKLNDAQGTVRPLSIPKSWKLISVSNGEKPNSNNLWFQDTDGSVYLLQEVTSQNELIIRQYIYKIPAKQ